MPRPLTFLGGLAAEIRRLLRTTNLRGLALIFAGAPLLAVDLWLIWILWRGGWSAVHAALQLEILGGLAFAHAALLGVVIISLAAVKLEAETKLGKLSIGAADDEAPAP